MAKSKKASVRVTAAEREKAAASAAARSQARRRAKAAEASGPTAGRQFEKSGAKAIRGHVQARGKRAQAKSDSR